MYGIAAFQEYRDADAMERFQEAYQRFPGSARIRFLLGQQYIRAQAVEKAFELFRSCQFPQVPREYTLEQARYAYLWQRYGDGLLFIRPFFEAYQQIKILDDHFLYVRGLPFFGQAWAYLAAFAILSGELVELESVTKNVIGNCQDYDFAFLQAELQAYSDDQPDCLLEALEKRLSAMREEDSPTAYTRMNIAVIKARAALSFDEANKLLVGVALSEQDFVWLQDIRTLALAEAANRLGDPALEQGFVAAFLERQPTLFAPDIALNFHLLRYQEKLRSKVAAQ